MQRRTVIAGLAGVATLPLAARAQQPTMPVIGWLHAESPEAMRDVIAAFEQGLAESGYVEGRNVAVEYRSAGGHFDRLPTLAADLVRRQVAVLVTPSSTPAALAAKAATQTIPIVFLVGANPIESGLVQSFNRPGGNLTGIAARSDDIAAKRIDLLHKLVPMAASIAMLVNPANSYITQVETRDVPSASRVLGVRVLLLNAETESDIAAAFATLIEHGIRALLIGSDAFFVTARDQIISLAARYAMPTQFYNSADVAAGGLMSYAPDFPGMFRQAGLYTGRILKGERPADLPVVQPTKFELAINLKTANTLGLSVPPTLLALADRVIE
jgi:putative tryptophan/tyrosine transport system substrate-binding protein